MKNNILKFIGFFVLVAFLASCDKEAFEEYSSVPADAANTATITVNSIEDSTAMVNYTLSTAGRIFIAVVPGTDETVTPDAQDILKLSVADAVFAKQIILNEANVLTGSVEVPDLVQNTSYKVFALPVNADGVLGTVVTTDAFSTSDTYVPTLDLDAGISPAISSSAAQSKDYAITLTFDEPVVLTPGFDIQIGYRDAETKVIGWIAVDEDSITVSGNKVTIKQMQELLNGQYVFLTIAQGAIIDRSGNEFEGVTSGIFGSPGALTGIYWRVSLKDKVELKVLPTDTVFVTNPTAFQVIKLVYPYNLNVLSLNDYESSFIKVKYFDAEVSQEFNISAENVDIDGDTLFVYIPRSGEYGSFITMSISKGALRDVYGNDIAAVEFGNYEWFVSYGYTRDLIIGDYTIGNLESYWDGPLATTYNVTISEDPEDENMVIIKGLMGSQDSLFAVFDGDLATFTIYPGEESGQLLTFATGHPYDAYTFEIWNPFNSGITSGEIASDGTINNLVLGVYFYKNDGSADGWFDIYTISTWTKNPKSISPNVIYSPIVSKAKGKKL